MNGDPTTIELRNRAQVLRLRSADVHPILATSYRRRACEVELVLWIHQIQCGHHMDDPPMAA